MTTVPARRPDRGLGNTPLVVTVIPFEDLDVLETIGCGSFGKVCKARYKGISKIVAYKEFGHFYNQRAEKQRSLVTEMENEADFLFGLTHPNIARLLGIVRETEHIGIVLEYAENKNLKIFLDNCSARFKEPVHWKLKTQMGHDICSGLTHLHTRIPPIVHGDIKIDNILVDDHLDVKITDFGLSKWNDFAEKYTNSTIRGNRAYIPPEKWLKCSLRPTEKFDVYSFAILLWEIYTEQAPYPDTQDAVMDVWVGKENHRPEMKQFPKDVPQLIAKLIVDCWDFEPNKRLPFKDILKTFGKVVVTPEFEEEIFNQKLNILQLQRKYRQGMSGISSGVPIEETQCSKELGDDRNPIDLSPGIDEPDTNKDQGAGPGKDQAYQREPSKPSPSEEQAHGLSEALCNHIKKVGPFVIGKINLTQEFLSGLKDRNVILETQRLEIANEADAYRQKVKLLDVISGRSEEAFDRFLAFLTEQGFDEAAFVLRPGSERTDAVVTLHVTLAVENREADNHIAERFNKYLAGDLTDLTGSLYRGLFNVLEIFQRGGLLLCGSSPTGSVCFYIVCNNGAQSLDQLRNMLETGLLKTLMESLVNNLYVSTDHISISVRTEEEIADRSIGEPARRNNDISAMDPPKPLPPVFISYRWHQKEKVKLLYKHLALSGYASWMDDNQMNAGDNLHDKMEEGITAAKVVVCCISKTYAESTNCKKEIQLAELREKKIIPLVMEKMDWPPLGLGITLSGLIYIKFYQLETESSSDDRYWPLDSFRQLLKSLKLVVAPEFDAITNEQTCALSSALRDHIKKVGPFVIGKINLAQEFLFELQKRNVILETQRLEIAEEVDAYHQKVKLLDVISGRSEKAFDTFLAFLTEQGFDEAALILRPGTTVVVCLYVTLVVDNREADNHISERLNQYLAGNVTGSQYQTLFDLLQFLQNNGLLFCGSSPTGSIRFFIICQNGAQSLELLRKMLDTGELKTLMEDLVNMLYFSKDRISINVSIEETTEETTEETKEETTEKLQRDNRETIEETTEGSAGIKELKKRFPMPRVLTAYSELSDLKSIGSGTFAQVFKAHHRGWRCTVAYKKTRMDCIDSTEHKKEISKMKREAAIHMELHHPNIVRMLAAIMEPGNYGLVLEYYEHGSLDRFLNYVKSDTYSMPWLLKAQMAHQISAGVNYLHGRRPHKIIHGDLKIQNVIVGNDFNAMITDFGLSQWREYTATYSSSEPPFGTPKHVPPEKWSNPKLPADQKFDVYGFGILLWELFSESEAYEASIGITVKDGERPDLKKIDVPPDAEFVKSLISDCWKQKPEDRPHFSEVLSTLESALNSSDSKNIRRAVLDLHLHIEEIENKKQQKRGHQPPAPSSKAWHDKLAKHRRTLMKYLECPYGLLDYLVSGEVLSVEEYYSIQSTSNFIEKNERLLNIMHRCSDLEKWKKFVASLHQTTQSHLARLVEDTADAEIGAKKDDRVLTEEELQKLLSLRVFLVNRIDLNPILDFLYSESCINEKHLESVRQSETRSDGIRTLLDIVGRRSFAHYTQFMNACRTFQDVKEQRLPVPPNVRDLERVRGTLVESIQGVDRLVAALYESGHMSEHEQQLINAQPTLNDRAHKLLDLLAKKPVEAYKCFLDTLVNTNQEHLAKLLTQTDRGVREHEQILKSMYRFLVDEMMTEGTLLDYLFMFEILDNQELDEIRAIPTQHKKHEKLLEFMMRATSAQYDKFLEALKESHQEHIWEALKKAEATTVD